MSNQIIFPMPKSGDKTRRIPLKEALRMVDPELMCDPPKKGWYRHQEIKNKE